jgi:hypothetical protein
MSQYTKSTNFATKDNLTPGDPLKVVRGTEIDTEFNNIATAVATKTDNASAAITGGSITGITDLAVADGGTGASTATAALNNLLPSQTGNSSKYLQTDGTNATWDAISINTGDITGTLPVANGGTGITSFGTGIATFLGTPSSANLASAVTDETGSGALVFANTPTLVAPILGTPTSGNFSSGSFTWPTFNQNTTGTAAGLSATLVIASGGTGQTTANAAFNALAPSQTSASGKYLKSDGTNTSWDALDISTADITGTLPVANGGTGVTSSTGTGNVVLSNSPTLVTPILGTPQSGNFSTGTFTWPTFNQNTSGTAAGLSATLATNRGGTNLTSFTSGGVVYASSSSALATGSALTFDGTTLGVNNGVTGGTALSLTGTYAGSGTVNLLTYQRVGGAVAGALRYSDDNPFGMMFGTTTSHAQIFMTANTERMRISSTGDVGIGTSSPFASPKLTVFNSATITTGGDGGGNGVFIAATTGSASNGQLVVAGSDTAAIDKGGAIVFAGKWDTATNDIAQWAKIAGYKENATNNNFAGYLGFYTRANGGAATERARITSDGNFGLGVTPNAWSAYKAIQTTGASFIGYSDGASNNQAMVVANAFYDSGANWKYIYTDNASRYQQLDGQHIWYNAPSGTAGDTISFTQAMTLDASGRLGIGTTTITRRLEVGSGAGDIKTAIGQSLICLSANSGNSGYVNEIGFGGSGATNVQSAIGNIVTNDTAAGNGALYFATRSVTTDTAPTERARITSAGNLSVGKLTAEESQASGNGFGFNVGGGSESYFTIVQTSASTGNACIYLNRKNSSGSMQVFQYDNTTIGSISHTSSVTLYNTTSDQRLKENIVDADSASSLIDALKVRQFDWKANSTHQRYGFVAQELVTVAPEAVYQPTDTDEMMAVDYSKLVPMLVKEIQSLRQRLSAANL